jgi:Raf kinase inhibitor-like YbhB/YbcL family protein
MRANNLCRAAVVLSLAALPVCQTAGHTGAAEPGGASMSKMTIASAAFEEGKEIPAKYTCEGEDTPPPLSWAGVPKNAASLALIVDDPDAPDPRAPKMTWVHWVLYNIPPSEPGLTEGARELPAGAKSGSNDWKRTSYGGPCPPVGRHRYFHKLYALDIVLPELGAATKSDLLRAMEGHVVAEATLMGTYQKR